MFRYAGAAIAFAAMTMTMTSATAQTVDRVDRERPGLRPLPVRVGGRVVAERAGGFRRQWPGSYFETAFRGPEAFFRVGPGEVALRISVDGGAAVALTRPAPGLYRVGGLGPAVHRLRIDVASESQSGPTLFGGFLAASDAAVPLSPPRMRRIEFIGDSHTVGYGNLSSTEQCSETRVWKTTDTTRGIARLTADHYRADYQVNAISGRGVVRNYNGFAAKTLPEAYSSILFDTTDTPTRAAGAPWQPQVIVIALGTNDFSTPLRAEERWKTRDALRADYEATYVRFVQGLRARAPRAYIVLWSTDYGDGEIRTEVGRVADRLRRAGDLRIGFIPVAGLAFSGCNHHPDVADDRRIADAVIDHLDAHADAWPR